MPASRRAHGRLSTAQAHPFRYFSHYAMGRPRSARGMGAGDIRGSVAVDWSMYEARMQH